MGSTISFDFKPDDYRKALQALAWQRGKKVVYTIAFCAVVVIALSLVRVWRNGTDDSLPLSLLLLFVVAVFNGLMIFALPLWQSRDALNKNLFQHTTVQIEEHRLVLRLQNGYSETIPYSHFVKASSNQHYAFYWKNSADAVILPQYAFPSASAYREHIRAIDAKLAL